MNAKWHLTIVEALAGRKVKSFQGGFGKVVSIAGKGTYSIYVSVGIIFKKSLQWVTFKIPPPRPASNLQRTPRQSSPETSSRAGRGRHSKLSPVADGPQEQSAHLPGGERAARARPSARAPPPQARAPPQTPLPFLPGQVRPRKSSPRPFTAARRFPQP